MVRPSKQSEKRSRFPRKTRNPMPKTGPLKENGFKKHLNAIEGESASLAFIPKIK